MYTYIYRAIYIFFTFWPNDEHYNRLNCLRTTTQYSQYWSPQGPHRYKISQFQFPDESCWRDHRGDVIERTETQVRLKIDSICLVAVAARLWDVLSGTSSTNTKSASTSWTWGKTIQNPHKCFVEKKYEFSHNFIWHSVEDLQATPCVTTIPCFSVGCECAITAVKSWASQWRSETWTCGYIHRRLYGRVEPPIAYLYLGSALLFPFFFFSSNEPKKKKKKNGTTVPFERKWTHKKTGVLCKAGKVSIEIHSKNSNFQRQTQARPQTLAHTPLHVTATLLHCL